jgi:hypothetical protein
MEFFAPSGAVVVINPAPWQDAKRLKNALEKEIALDASFSLSLDADLIATILRVDSSEAVDAALWPCLGRCLRGKEKIAPAVFDDVAARADYYQIVKACIEENLRPLVESLSSVLIDLGILRKQAEAPASPSTTK